MIKIELHPFSPSLSSLCASYLPSFQSLTCSPHSQIDGPLLFDNYRSIYHCWETGSWTSLRINSWYIVVKFGSWIFRLATLLPLERHGSSSALTVAILGIDSKEGTLNKPLKHAKPERCQDSTLQYTANSGISLVQMEQNLDFGHAESLWRASRFLEWVCANVSFCHVTITTQTVICSSNWCLLKVEGSDSISPQQTRITLAAYCVCTFGWAAQLVGLSFLGDELEIGVLLFLLKWICEHWMMMV